MGARIGDRAVVIGAGVAGLLTARALAGSYAEVVVVDRDSLADGVEPRRGVPQARHAHALAARGQQLLEELFPGFSDELVAAGAQRGDIPADVRMYVGGHRLRPCRSGLVVLSLSRSLLEGHLRARVRALPQVRLRERCDVVGLIAAPGGDRVTGVRLLPRADDGATEDLAADVVVDASGRSSRAGAWLAPFGVSPPVEARIPIDVAYASRHYRLDRAALGGDLAIINGPTPAHSRAGVLGVLEGARAMVTLAGVLGDRPPLDADGFTAFARSLRFPDIHDAIAGAEPLDAPVPYRFPASTWRRWDRTDVPDGFVLTGDGVCSLNPIYGQGMTLAAAQATALLGHLEQHGRLEPRRFHREPRRFHREQARIVGPAWKLAAGSDEAFPGVAPRRGAGARLLGAYVTRVQARAAEDPAVAVAFARVAGMVDRPQALLRPGVARRVLAPGRSRATDPTGGDRTGPAGLTAPTR